jgi:hypothetical protein
VEGVRGSLPGRVLPRFLGPDEGLSTTRDNLLHHARVGVPSVQVLCAVPRFRQGRSCGWFGRLCGQAHGGLDHEVIVEAPGTAPFRGSEKTEWGRHVGS